MWTALAVASGQPQFSDVEKKIESGFDAPVQKAGPIDWANSSNERESRSLSDGLRRVSRYSENYICGWKGIIREFNLKHGLFATRHFANYESIAVEGMPARGRDWRIHGASRIAVVSRKVKLCALGLCGEVNEFAVRSVTEHLHYEFEFVTRSSILKINR